MIDLYPTRTRDFPDDTPVIDTLEGASAADQSDQPDSTARQRDNSTPTPLPDGLLPVLMAAIQADAAEDAEYALVHKDSFYGALNAAHELYASFTPTGVDLTVDSKVDGTDPWHCRMELLGCGYGDHIKPMPQ